MAYRLKKIQYKVSNMMTGTINVIYWHMKNDFFRDAGRDVMTLLLNILFLFVSNCPAPIFKSYVYIHNNCPRTKVIIYFFRMKMDRVHCLQQGMFCY